MKFYLQYISGIEEYALGFNKIEHPLMYSSRAEAMAFCIDYCGREPFEIIDVDDNNWQELFDSGAFDYEPER
ncbi:MULTISPECIES: hypothetical protein [unclassified Pseudoalteromonas]|uniref:hypothetical protein n=1 Tax=unclassified Pseudoalteromonas TaxID=194690 RepID=UPI0025B525CA|nr:MULTISPECIES: hypothetical protein [unclassified Pseudoalteromonas]MDN3377951.1 hypothetical protein [Pseudoalteromonas sp. APC 3893]MDN3386146.1 hypothetical protein [Pseudoalteromonas sp. APC 4017]